MVPFLMNCVEEHSNLVSMAVPVGIQDNATFVLDLNALNDRKDLYADDNGSWVMNGCKTKWYTIVKDDERKVTDLIKTDNEADSDVAVKRRTYSCSSSKLYHKTIVSVEFDKDIEKWYPIVLLHYYFDGQPTKFEVKQHGKRKSSEMPYVRVKESTKKCIAEKSKQFAPKRALFEARKSVGGIFYAESTGSLPRNLDQVKYLKVWYCITRDMEVTWAGYGQRKMVP